MTLKDMAIAEPVHDLPILYSELPTFHPMVGCPYFWRWITGSKCWVPTTAQPPMKVPAFIVKRLDRATCRFAG